jgi:hypothetical protein
MSELTKMSEMYIDFIKNRIDNKNEMYERVNYFLNEYLKIKNDFINKLNLCIVKNENVEFYNINDTIENDTLCVIVYNIVYVNIYHVNCVDKLILSIDNDDLCLIDNDCTLQHLSYIFLKNELNVNYFEEV